MLEFVDLALFVVEQLSLKFDLGLERDDFGLELAGGEGVLFRKTLVGGFEVSETVF